MTGSAGRPLNNRHRLFVAEYLADPHLNATQAYIKAGYKARGNAAETNAARLLRNAQVVDAISEAMAARAERIMVDADYVLAGLKREAEHTGDGASHSARVSALVALGKHLGMFVDKHEVKATGTLAIVEEIVDADSDGTAPPGAG